MNGKEYDELLLKIKNTRSPKNLLKTTDPEDYCMVIYDMSNITSEKLYGIYTKERIFYTPSKVAEQRDKLEKKIDQADFGQETVKLAYKLADILYDYYEARLREYTEKYVKHIRINIYNYDYKVYMISILHQLLQIIVIAGAAIVPFLLTISEVSKLIPTIISAIVAVTASLLKYYKFSENINYTNQLKERLSNEITLFETRRSCYAKVDRGEALDLFMDKIDEIKEEQKKLSIFLESATQESKLNKILQEINHR